MVLQDSVEASSDMRDAGDVCLDEVWEDGMLSVSAWLGPCSQSISTSCSSANRCVKGGVRCLAAERVAARAHCVLWGRSGRGTPPWGLGGGGGGTYAEVLGPTATRPGPQSPSDRCGMRPIWIRSSDDRMMALRSRPGAVHFSTPTPAVAAGGVRPNM